ncbi:armadillo-like helical domain-containing protein 4 isoform X2 [Clinocottus analis]|uniref:armadillo-like helical domain-containing protein 4 isoform X2 n=1 Tax=Clinocottus analis TaxID=304258 RepID=UPI0035BEB6FB
MDLFWPPPRSPPQLSITAGEVKGQGEEVRTKPDPETSSPSTTGPPNPGAAIQKLASPGSIPPTAFVSPQTSTHVSIWGHDETMASLPDPLLPEIGPNLMLREDGPESLWTEAARPSGVDTPVPPSQDEATEGTMSSEALPLIFEPFEDVTSEAAAVTLVPGDAQPPASMATGGATPQSEVDLDRLVGGEPNGDGGGPSHAPSSLLVPDWTSPWQTSGGELLEPIGSSGPSVPQPQAGGEDNAERGAARTPGLEERSPATGPSPSPSSSSFFRRAMTTVTTATHRPAAHKSRSGLEEMESEEDPDEDEENSEESVEDDSEEDQTETPKTSSTRPPYSLIPPPSVWVQRNQGLMRSWVELIREKAGYVSGMLAPVGIGITGALLIVGVLYSVRVIHRKRRNSFKHQRRKVRQPEQPREPGTSRQDQAMLLADSSEDEF